jgi:hypothetical protein
VVHRNIHQATAQSFYFAFDRQASYTFAHLAILFGTSPLSREKQLEVSINGVTRW